MELMKQFKAQTGSTIGGFLRQLSERKDIDIQKCSFIQELNGMTGVYIVASDKEAVVLALDALPGEEDELIDEYSFHGGEPLWFTGSHHRVSPVYIVRQVMSLLSLCYKKADKRNIAVGGALLSNNSLMDADKFAKLFDQVNVVVLDEIGTKEDALCLNEHAVEGNCTQQVLSDMNSSYSLMGLPDLVHSADYLPKDDSCLEPNVVAKAPQEEKTNSGQKPQRTTRKKKAKKPSKDGEPEDMDSFERELLDLFGPLEGSKPDSSPTSNDDNHHSERDLFGSDFLDFDLEDLELDDDDEDEVSANDFLDHMKEVQESLNEQYPTGPGGVCNIPSRVQVRPPLTTPKEEFDKLVGCDEIRQQIEALTLMSKYAKRLKAADPGIKSHHITLHAVFTGNPGTGKSTVCKLYGALLRQAGVLKYGHVVVVDRSSFIGNCWGDEEKSVRALLQLARGGVLMVDEAYQLLGDGHPTDPGRLVLPLMMNHLADPEWSDVAVVLCGYPQPMRKLLNQNPGLKSRFPNHFEFKDFEVEMLEQITLNRIAEYGYHFAPAAWAKYRWFLREAFDNRGDDWSNARFVTNWLERIYVWHGVRCERKDIRDPEKLRTLTKEDVREPDAPF